MKPKILQEIDDINSSLAEIATINVRKFGVKGDGVTDDSITLQAAIKYCFDNNANLEGFPGTCVINSKVYIPQNENFNKQIKIDFKGMTFKLADGGTLFESGKYVNGVWESTLENAENSFGITLTGFNIEGGTYGIRLNHWHQGSILKDISANNCKTVLDMNNPYYCAFHNIKSMSDDTTYVDTRFIFRGACNLMVIEGLSAGNSNIAYKFDGVVSSVDFRNNDIEGCNIGVQFNQDVQSIKIDSNYTEHVSDVIFQFNNDVDYAPITNTYVNFHNDSNMYFVQHTSGARSGIKIDNTNNFNNIYSFANVFKSKDGWGYIKYETSNVQIASDLSNLPIDSTKLPLNTSLDGVGFFGFNEAIAKLNTGICEGNYSGRMTTGYKYDQKLYGVTINNNVGTNVFYNTKIIYQERQVLYINIKITTANGDVVIRGLAIGTDFYSFGDTFAKSTDIAVGVDGYGYVYLVTKALDNGGNSNYAFVTRGAEVRII